jgi:EAL and modified HD-GYP domain-containing signal transduction protein
MPDSDVMDLTAGRQAPALSDVSVQQLAHSLPRVTSMFLCSFERSVTLCLSRRACCSIRCSMCRNCSQQKIHNDEHVFAMSPASQTPPALGRARAMSRLGRRPIVDQHRALAAYRSPGATTRDAGHVHPTAPVHPPQDALEPTKPTFVACTFDDLSEEALAWLDPERTVLEMQLLPADEQQQLSLVHARSAGFALALDARILAKEHAHLAPLAQYVVLPMGAIALDEAASVAQALAVRPGPKALATKVRSSVEYQTLMDAGVTLFEGDWFVQPDVLRPQNVPLGFAGLICLLNLVSANAELEEIEELLRQEPTLSFKLLSHINSCGFGQRVEVESFRHAVMLMGLKRLFRWTAMLVARTPPDAVAPATGSLAMVRGRFMELVTHSTDPMADGDLAFMTGMFSLLGALLNVPLGHALSLIHVPQPVTQALMEGTGPFAVHLGASLAAEAADIDALTLAAARLGTSEAHLLTLHGQALAWVESLSK